ncbi:hypothetical protein T484DRAFT_1889535 [Baffinella frigidus]|nr:hypothetical protein T484DRAFT_1889535 [Cryptophyta sp. CCMP2293]
MQLSGEGAEQTGGGGGAEGSADEQARTLLGGKGGRAREGAGVGNAAAIPQSILEWVGNLPLGGEGPDVSPAEGSMGEGVVGKMESGKEGTMGEVEGDGRDGGAHGEKVVVSQGDLRVFIVRWRAHFIKTVRPRHLPKGWSIDNPLPAE